MSEAAMRGTTVAESSRRGLLSLHVVAAVVTLLVLAPLARPGYVLRYDMVFVPTPPFGPLVWGSGGELPRAVPSELLAVSLARLLPADLAQKLLLAAVLMLAIVGAARLTPTRHPLARITAGLFYAWNPWVYSRLHLGQWAILTGYAALPWVYTWVLRVLRPPADRWNSPTRDGLPGRGAAVAGALPVVLGGPAMVLTAVLTGAPALLLARRWRALAAATVTLAGLAAPWLLAWAGRDGGVGTDPRGVTAFAVRADTPLGIPGSLLTLGGVWSRHATPASRGSWLVAFLALGLAVVAVGAFGLARHRWPTPAWSGLVIGAVAGTSFAMLSAWAPGRELMTTAVAHVPALAAVRDGARLLAPLALLQAVGLGLAVRWCLSRPARYGLAAVLMLWPLAVLPGLAWGLGGQLRPVHYPPEWATVRALVAADPTPGAVLSLPWSSLRSYRWAGRVPVLDPAARAFDRPVLGDQDVLVGQLRIRGESRKARLVAEVLAGSGDPVPALRGLGVRYILLQTDQPGAGPALARFTGGEAELVYRGSTLTLLRLPGAGEPVTGGGNPIASEGEHATGAGGPDAGTSPDLFALLGYGSLGGTILIVVSYPAYRRRRMLLSGHLPGGDR